MIKKMLKKCYIQYRRMILPLQRLYLSMWYKHTIYPKKMEKLKDIHKNERCFIIGNAPNLTPEDLNKIKGEYTFSCNKIYKILEKTYWRPCYYVVDDFGYVKTDYENIRKLGTKQTFIGLETSPKYAKRYKDSDVIIFRKKTCIKNSLPQLSDLIHDYIGAGHTVLLPAFQIACYMGFTEIYFIGVSGNYSLIGQNHFYDSKDIASQQAVDSANLMKYAFEAIRVYSEQHDIKVYNASRDSKLQCFKRKNLDDVIK